MENVMIVEEKTSSVVEKKETYKKSELVSLREEIASYVEQIKFHKAEARKLKGKERYDKRMLANGLGEAVRWRYLSYALLRGRDIRDVERSFRDYWRRSPGVANTILFHIPKDQHRFWGLQEVKNRLENLYVYDSVSYKRYSIGKENP